MTDLALLRGGVEAADALLLDLYGLAPLSKADANPLSPRGFDALVLGMLRELRAKATGQERKAVAAYVKLLDRDWSKLRPEQREQAFRDAAERMLGFGPDVGASVGEVVRHVGPTIMRGTRAALIQRDNLKIEPSFNAVDARMTAAAAGQQALFVRDEFGRRVDYLSGKARLIVANGMDDGLDRHDIAAALQADLTLAAANRADSYWQVVASAFVARARTFGTLTSFDEAGIESYQFEAVLDEVTTEVCRFMHGKTFSTGASLARFGEVEQATDPEDVKSLQPWAGSGKSDGGAALFYKANGARHMIARVDEAGYGAKDKVGRYSGAMSSDAMQKAGLTQPPLHGHCRSTIVPVFGSVSVPRAPAPAPAAGPTPPVPLPAAGPPAPVAPPAWTVTGPPVNGVPPFSREDGSPVEPEELSARTEAALRQLYGASEKDLRSAAKFGPRVSEEDLSALREALSAALGKKGDLGKLAGKDTRWVKPDDLGRVLAPRDPLDRDKVAGYVAGGPRLDGKPKNLREASAYPLLVKHNGQVVLLEGGERWTADQLFAAHGPDWAKNPGVSARVIDLDALKQRAGEHPLGQALASADVKAVSGRLAESLKKLSGGGDAPEDQRAGREAVRDLLRAQGIVPRDLTLRARRPGLFDSDVPDAGGNKLAVVQQKDLPSGAEAVHGWDGKVRVRETDAETARKALDALAKDPRAFAGKPWRDVNHTVDSVSTFVHEEIHGASRIKDSAYVGAGLGMEEAATEILARKTSRELFGFKLTGAADAASVPLGLPVALRGSDGAVWNYSHSGNGGAYNGYIEGLFHETAKVAGHDGIHGRIEQALLRTRGGKPDDAEWTKPEEQIRAYVNALELPKADGDRLFSALAGAGSPLRKK